MAFFAIPALAAPAPHSTARLWDEALLQAIRTDYARPTVNARNLFHLSVALYDSWALYDASIAAWGLKGYYQGSRPITAIRYMAELGQATDPKLPHYDSRGLHLKAGLVELITPELTAPGEHLARLVGHESEIAIYSWRGIPKDPSREFKGVGWILASEWVPYQRQTFVTPPFPGFVSGHSTFSRSGAEVMTAITGSRFFPSGMAEFVTEKNKFLVFEEGPSDTMRLQWATYYDAADQCSVSRIFGGIHGFMDDFPGRRIGSVIGRKAVARANDLFGDFSVSPLLLP